MEQRRFATMGQNLFLILAKFTRNQTLCRLLHYTDKDPLNSNKADVSGVNLIHRNLLVIPKIPDNLPTKENFVIVGYDSFYVNPTNNEFKISTVQIGIVCPFEEWQLDTNSLRPFLIMEEIDKELNQHKLNGIGTLSLDSVSQLTLSGQLGGFTMEYVNNEFN